MLFEPFLIVTRLVELDIPVDRLKLSLLNFPRLHNYSSPNSTCKTQRSNSLQKITMSYRHVRCLASLGVYRFTFLSNCTQKLRMGRCLFKPGFHIIVRIVPVVSKNIQTIGTIIWKRYSDDRKRPGRFKIYTIVPIVRIELNSIQAIGIVSVVRVVCDRLGSVSI